MAYYKHPKQLLQDIPEYTKKWYGRDVAVPGLLGRHGSLRLHAYRLDKRRFRRGDSSGQCGGAYGKLGRCGLAQRPRGRRHHRRCRCGAGLCTSAPGAVFNALHP